MADPRQDIKRVSSILYCNLTFITEFIFFTIFEFSRQFQLSNASSSSIVTPAYCWATPPLTPSRDSGHASSISTSSNISSLLDEEFGDFEEFVVLDTKVDPPKTIKMTKSKVRFIIFFQIQ